MNSDLLILIVSFFSIALIYASVGFGGGSSYLALLAVMGVHYETIRPTALLCNIIVVSGGVY
ncbi:sulfite exporter TauE/SafE family protein, partial [Fulvivirgaceae bacterium PWU4]|nr:sulfite exporter TauE/SafE family protein [Chryseosolibacter histidini]